MKWQTLGDDARSWKERGKFNVGRKDSLCEGDSGNKFIRDRVAKMMILIALNSITRIER